MTLAWQEIDYSSTVFSFCQNYQYLRFKFLLGYIFSLHINHLKETFIMEEGDNIYAFSDYESESSESNNYSDTSAATFQYISNEGISE